MDHLCEFDTYAEQRWYDPLECSMIRRSLMVLSRGVGVANSVEEGSMLSSMTFFTINNQIHDNNKLMTTLANLEYLNVKIFILIINPYFPRFKQTSKSFTKYSLLP